MKKIFWIPLAVFLLSLGVLFRPAGKIATDLSVSENRVLIQYEQYGCGSRVVKVLSGGDAIAAQYKEAYPEIGTNEIVFAKGSDEPRLQMDEAAFRTAGIAEKYTYIVEGKAVGVTEGAPDCCEPVPAYNAHVVEFLAEDWYYTSYVPYIAIAKIEVIMVALFFAALSGGCSIMLCFTGWFRRKFEMEIKKD